MHFLKFLFLDIFSLVGIYLLCKELMWRMYCMSPLLKSSILQCLCVTLSINGAQDKQYKQYQINNVYMSGEVLERLAPLFPPPSALLSKVCALGP